MRSPTGSGLDRPSAERPARAVGPVAGVVLLVAVTVLLAGVLAVAMSGVSSESSPPAATFEVTADAGTERLTLEHAGGDPVDVTALSLRVAVDGESLRHQPPVPFFSARGFESGPTGPFNPAADAEWTAGTSASLGVAGTNEPGIEAGDRVRVTLLVDGHRIAELEAVAEDVD